MMQLLIKYGNIVLTTTTGRRVRYHLCLLLLVRQTGYIVNDKRLSSRYARKRRSSCQEEKKLKKKWLEAEDSFDSLDRLRDGKPKTVVASFRAALRAYYKGIKKKAAKKPKEAKKPVPPCQAGSIARFFTTPNQGLEGESDPH